MRHHEQISNRRWAVAVRRIGRGVAALVGGPQSAAVWAVSQPYPLSGGVPGYPIARDAARWRR
jgi:hypothetical protein